MATTIYGSSDDLVGFSGDVYGEVSCFDYEDGIMIACSDGTLLEVVYRDDGFWSMRPIRQGDLFEKITHCTRVDDSDHSDRAIFKDGLKWAYAFRQWEKVR